MKPEIHARTKIRTLGIAAGLCAVLCAGQTASAASNTWKSTGATDWFSPENWSLGAQPTSADSVLIPNVASSPVISGGAAKAASLYVGYTGTSTLTIQNGGSLVTGTTSVGGGGTGTILIDGAGSSLTNTGSSFSLGSSRTGTLTVADGGTVKVGSTGAGTITIASSPTGLGTLNIGAPAGSPAVAPGTVIAGAITTATAPNPAIHGTVNFNHTGTDYTFDTLISGNTTVRQTAGVTILTAANTYSAPTSIQGGTLEVTNGSGLGTGTVALSGGTLDLGGASALTLSLGAGALFSIFDGTLRMNILSPDSYDRISGDGGILSISGGNLDLTDSTLDAGSYSLLIGFDSASSGGFDTITGYDVSRYAVSFHLSGGVGTLSVSPITAVPKPHCVAIAVVFVLGVIVLARRRQISSGGFAVRG